MKPVPNLTSRRAGEPQTASLEIPRSPAGNDLESFSVSINILPEVRRALEEVLPRVVDSIAIFDSDDKVVAPRAASGAAMNDSPGAAIRIESSEPKTDPTIPKIGAQSESGVEPEEATNPATAVDPNDVRNLRAEGDGLLDELVEMFTQCAPALVREMEEGLGRGDLDLVGFRAHRLKGTAATFGALRLVDLCQRLDAAAKSKDSESARALYDQVKPECERVLRALEAERGPVAATASTTAE